MTDPARAAVRELFAEWSGRTFSTYWRAHCQLQALEDYGAISPQRRVQIIAQASRANGSLNVSKFAELAQDQAAMYAASLPG